MSQNLPAVHSGPTMRSLRERQRAERAALILDAAQEVFTTRGYYDASIDEIAARAGIAKGTVYLHFAGKEDLLVALIEQQIVGFLACVDQVSTETRAVRARLEQILLYVYLRMQEKRNRVLLELDNSIGLTRSVIEKREGLKAHLAQAMERIAALLSAASFSRAVWLRRRPRPSEALVNSRDRSLCYDHIHALNSEPPEPVCPRYRLGDQAARHPRLL
ncbi:MAG TPA: helix-turn-helix domain-containing protein [Herpetosiphonaceae bacterium]|nr:helix-turn-helix domain-containing protein [Herpetosiphonaceae bacterium]